MTIRVSGLLARFAVEGGNLTAAAVKPKLFRPNRELKLSIFYVDGLDDPEIRAIGDNVVRLHRTAKRLHGWGEFGEAAVAKANLRIDRDDDPPRHANIVDWPTSAGERKQRQIFLAKCARPVQVQVGG